MTLTITAAGTGGNTTSSTTSVTCTTTTAMVAGDVIVGAMAFDNSGSGGGNPMSAQSMSGFTAGSALVNTMRLCDPSTASNGLVLWWAAYKLTADLASSSTITFQWTGNVNTKAVALWKVSTDNGYDLSLGFGNSGTAFTTANTSHSITTSTVANNDLIVFVCGREYGEAISITAPASNRLGEQGSNVGSTTSGQGVRGCGYISGGATYTFTFGGTSTEAAAGYFTIHATRPDRTGTIAKTEARDTSSAEGTVTNPPTPFELVQGWKSNHTYAVEPTSLTTSWDQAPAAGNLLLCAVVSDSYPVTVDGWTAIEDQLNYCGGYLFYKIAGGSEGDVVAVPNSGASTCMAIAEYSGFGSSPADTAHTSSGSNSYQETWSTGTTGTTTQADELAVAVIGGSDGNQWSVFAPRVDTWSNSFIEQADISTLKSSGTNVSLAVATKRLSSTGTVSTTVDFSYGTWPVGLIACFKIDEGGDGGITGTVACTEAADTSNATGSRGIPDRTGTVDKTNANDTSNASGTRTIPSFTGTVAKTEAVDTPNISGTRTIPPYTGTITKTEAGDTSSASGSRTIPPITGTLTRTNANDTSNASGTRVLPPITGTVSRTNADDTSSASGSRTIPPYTGTLAKTELADTPNASGSRTIPPRTGTISFHENEDEMEPPSVATRTLPPITGTLSRTNASDTSNITGVVTGPGAVTGAVVVTEARDTSNASGSRTIPVYTGTLTRTESADTPNITGSRTIPPRTGTLARTEGADTANASGTITGPGIRTGTIAVTNSSDTLSATGSRSIPGRTGVVSATEAADVPSASGTRSIPLRTGTINRTNASDTLSASGTIVGPLIIGTVDVVMKADVCSASGTRAIPPRTGTTAVIEHPDIADIVGSWVSKYRLVLPTYPVLNWSGTTCDAMSSGTTARAVSGTCAEATDSRVSVGAEPSITGVTA